MLAAAEAAILQSQAARTLAATDLDNTVVRAPVSGVFGNRQIRAGKFLTPVASVLEIVRADDVWIAGILATEPVTLRTQTTLQLLAMARSEVVATLGSTRFQEMLATGRLRPSRMASISS